MKHWFLVAAGAGVGYALGTQTGQAVRRGSRTLWDHPVSQGTLAIARGTAERWGNAILPSPRAWSAGSYDPSAGHPYGARHTPETGAGGSPRGRGWTRERWPSAAGPERVPANSLIG